MCRGASTLTKNISESKSTSTSDRYREKLMKKGLERTYTSTFRYHTLNLSKHRKKEKKSALSMIEERSKNNRQEFGDVLILN